MRLLKSPGRRGERWSLDLLPAAIYRSA